MRRLRWVGSLKTKGSFAKEPSKRDYTLQKRPVFFQQVCRRVVVCRVWRRESHVSQSRVSHVNPKTFIWETWLCRMNFSAISRHSYTRVSSMRVSYMRVSYMRVFYMRVSSMRDMTLTHDLLCHALYRLCRCVTYLGVCGCVWVCDSSFPVCVSHWKDNVSSCVSRCVGVTHRWRVTHLYTHPYEPHTYTRRVTNIHTPIWVTHLHKTSHPQDECDTYTHPWVPHLYTRSHEPTHSSFLCDS